MFVTTLLPCEVLRRRLLVFLNVHRLISDVAPQSLSFTKWLCTWEKATHLCFVRVCSCSQNVKKKPKRYWRGYTGSPATWSIFCACNALCWVFKLSKIWYFPLCFSNSHNYMEIILKAGHLLQILKKENARGKSYCLRLHCCNCCDQTVWSDRSGLGGCCFQLVPSSSVIRLTCFIVLWNNPC